MIPFPFMSYCWTLSFIITCKHFKSKWYHFELNNNKYIFIPILLLLHSAYSLQTLPWKTVKFHSVHCHIDAAVNFTHIWALSSYSLVYFELEDRLSSNDLLWNHPLCFQILKHLHNTLLQLCRNNSPSSYLTVKHPFMFKYVAWIVLSGLKTNRFVI